MQSSAPPSALDADDEAELRMMLLGCKRPRVAEALRVILAGGSDTAVAAQRGVPTPAAVGGFSSVPLLVPSAAAVLASGAESAPCAAVLGAAAPGATSAAAALAAWAPPRGTAVREPRYGWEQTQEAVTVLCFDLPGVGAAKARVHCSFSETGFDLAFDVNGAWYRLAVPLEGCISPPDSSFRVKKSSIELTLVKAKKFTHWRELRRGADAEPDYKPPRKDDPTAGLLDVVKNMYARGDDATRKAIGEAMLRSRDPEEEARVAANSAARLASARAEYGEGGMFGDYGGEAGEGEDLL